MDRPSESDFKREGLEVCSKHKQWMLIMCGARGQERLKRLNHLKNYSSKKSYLCNSCTNMFYAIEQVREVVIYVVKR